MDGKKFSLPVPCNYYQGSLDDGYYFRFREGFGKQDVITSLEKSNNWYSSSDNQIYFSYKKTVTHYFLIIFGIGDDVDSNMNSNTSISMFSRNGFDRLLIPYMFLKDKSDYKRFKTNGNGSTSIEVGNFDTFFGENNRFESSGSYKDFKEFYLDSPQKNFEYNDDASTLTFSSFIRFTFGEGYFEVSNIFSLDRL